MAENKKYNMILMDIQMPVMDGIEAVEIIRSLSTDYAKLPVIAVTANNMKGDRERYIASGYTDHIAKPISKYALFSMLVKYLPSHTGREKQAG